MSSDRDPEIVAARKVADDALLKLSEYCDSVQIFCSKANEGQGNGTASFSIGYGNWFARLGHVRLWLKGEEAIECCRLIREDEANEADEEEGG